MNVLLKLVLSFVLFVILLVPCRAQTWLTNGLLAYYPFTGNPLDASGNGHDGSATAVTLVEDRFGVSDAAYAFDSDDSVVAVPHDPVFNFPGNSDFTISVWAALNIPRPGSPPFYMVSKDNGGGPLAKWVFGLGVTPESSGKRALFFHFNNPGFVGHWLADNREHNVTSRRWHHYVIAKVGTEYSIHVDGEFFASETSTSEIPADITASMTIGHAEGASINGTLDDIRIYSRALTAAEIAALHVIEAPVRINVKKAVYVDSNTLKPGTTYQLQTSVDLLNWQNFGQAFTATNSSWRSSDYWDVGNWNDLFFRFQVE